ncbi:hypothetical protein ACHAW6_007288 [Cyclotella cf. meneghiniana]
MVTAETKHALQCRGLTQAWHEWKQLPAIQHTWLNWKTHWTAAFEEQQDITCLMGGNFTTQANPAVDDSQWSTQMITSFDNLANAAVQKNNAVERLVMANTQLTDTVTKLQDDNTKLLSVIEHMTDGTSKDTVTPMVTEFTSGTTAKHADTKTGHEDHATCKNTMGDSQDNNCSGASRQTTDYKIINYIYLTPGCTNPPDLHTPALLDTAANISLLTTNALALQDPINLSSKIIIQPSGDLITTSSCASLSLPKLPPSAKHAYHVQDSPTMCYQQPLLQMQAVNYFFIRPEIILRGWQDPTTRLWQVSLQITDGHNTIPHDASIVSPTEPTQTNSIYACENTRQLIIFYYATMGYPVVSTWCKAIDKGYLRGWNGLTSERIRCFIKPSEHNLMGHLDQIHQGIRSTKSSSDSTTPDPMEEPQQLPLNNNANMLFMTMVDIEEQLFTDQTEQFRSLPAKATITLLYIKQSMPITLSHTQSNHTTERSTFVLSVMYTCTNVCRDIAHNYTN